MMLHVVFQIIQLHIPDVLTFAVVIGGKGDLLASVTVYLPVLLVGLLAAVAIPK